MKLSIRVYYRLDFLPIIGSFVSETARVFGANDEEISALSIAAEETGMLIVNSFPPEDIEDVFEVNCNVYSDGLEYEFKNLGAPLNLNNMPTYDPNSPNSSIEGLGLFLAEKMMDKLEFINRGNEGWCTKLFKKINVLMPLAETKINNEIDLSKERINSRLALPSDAFDIVQLSYMNYRYSYTKESFYYVEKLKQDFEEKKIVSFIAKNESDNIVGHLARIIDPENPLIAEVGAIMIQPEYRKSLGLFSLMKSFLKYSDEFKEVIEILETNLVTSHVLSQKIAAIMAFKPTAFNFSTHEKAKFMAIDVNPGRETNLFAIWKQKEIKPFKINVPKEHQEIAEIIFQKTSLPIEINSSNLLSQNLKTKWVTLHKKKTNYARLFAEEIGVDFETSLKVNSYKLLNDNIATTTICVPLWKEIPDNLDEILKDQFFFFSGFVPSTPDKWYILYTRFTNQNFNFEDVMVHDPIAVDLLDYIKKCYSSLFNEQLLDSMDNQVNSKYSIY